MKSADLIIGAGLLAAFASASGEVRAQPALLGLPPPPVVNETDPNFKTSGECVWTNLPSTSRAVLSDATWSGSNYVEVGRSLGQVSHWRDILLACDARYDQHKADSQLVILSHVMLRALQAKLPLVGVRSSDLTETWSSALAERAAARQTALGLTSQGIQYRETEWAVSLTDKYLNAHPGMTSERHRLVQVFFWMGIDESLPAILT